MKQHPKQSPSTILTAILLAKWIYIAFELFWICIGNSKDEEEEEEVKKMRRDERKHEQSTITIAVSGYL